MEHSYIANLRASFKVFDAASRKDKPDNAEESSASNDTLSVLHALLFDGDIEGISTMEKHAKSLIES